MPGLEKYLCIYLLRLYTVVRLQNTGIYAIFNPKALERSEGTTKGLGVINFVVPCVLKSNFLDHRHVRVPLAAAVIPQHRENVAVISSNNSFLYMMRTGSQRYG